jgi:hypothetical protein
VRRAGMLAIASAAAGAPVPLVSRLTLDARGAPLRPPEAYGLRMSIEHAGGGPLQLVLVGFETTERFQGDIARELLDLRGRGMIRVLDARFFHRSPNGDLTEIDIGPLLAEQPEARSNPIARLLGVNGAGGNGGMAPSEAFARTAGFALEDLRGLTEQIGPGDYAAGVLVEHVWAAHLRDAVLAAGGRLLGQGFLTPEVVMVVGAEIQARADAEAALELANAARGSALVEALSILTRRERGSAKDAARAAAEVVRVLAAEGFVQESEASAAIDALVKAGLIELATLEAAAAEAEDMLSEPPDEERD